MLLDLLLFADRHPLLSEARRLAVIRADAPMRLLCGWGEMGCAFHGVPCTPMLRWYPVLAALAEGGGRRGWPNVYVDGVRDGVGVQLLLEDVAGGLVGADGAVDLGVAGVLLEDGRAGEAEQLRLGKERLDGLVVVAELGAVALVEDDDQALVAQRCEAFFLGALALLLVLLDAIAGLIQRQAELLDGGDDDLVGVVVGEQPAHQGLGVGVLLEAAFLEAVEFVARLAVEALAVDHEQAFLDVRVVLEQRRCLG